MEVLINELNKQNPWWNDKAQFAYDLQQNKRKVFAEIWEKVTGRELILAITGLRRIGKTTLLKQVINELLLKEKIERKKILYFSFDDYGIYQKSETLEKIIEYQIRLFPKEKIYLFFDEIQYVDNWNAILKKYFDLCPQIKFVISGSSSLFLTTKAKESLAGRIQIKHMYPLSFGEYLLINKKISIPEGDFLETDKLESFEEVLQENFLDYLSFGEFPYLTKLSGWEEKREYLLNFIIGKVVESDLPKIKKIYQVDELKNLVNILFQNSGQVVEMQNLGSDLGLAAKTLRDYLHLLENTFLFCQIFNKGIGFRERSLRQRKIYPTSTNALVLKMNERENFDLLNINMGRFAENFVFNYLNRFISHDIYFFRQREIKEVDFLITTKDGFLPIEVKYQNSINKSDLKNLIYYCQKEKLTKAMIITKTSKEEIDIENIKIKLIPAHFLVW